MFAHIDTTNEPGRGGRAESAESGRSSQLLEAAVAGLVLSFNPRDYEMRAQAAAAWEGIRAVLADDVLAEEVGAAPWTRDSSHYPRATADLLKKRYLELRTLAHLIKDISFESSTNSEVSVAGRALCRLAVCLDDLINGSDRRVSPKLRQYVLAQRMTH
jgi:hypothetical protein